MRGTRLREEGALNANLRDQTKADEQMAIRLLAYHIALMRQHLAAGYKKLPLILNMFLYAGQDSYPPSYPWMLLKALRSFPACSPITFS